MENKTPRINKKITYAKLRVIGMDGKQLGILSRQEALTLASEQGLDLVEVSPNVDPPVCRIMDYGKYKYEQSKKIHKKRSLQTVHKKEVKFRPFTGKHDFEVKLRHILDFLEKGNKVKVTVIFRGRELRYQEQGLNILQAIKEEIKDFGVVEQEIRNEGRNVVMQLGPKR